MTTDEKKAVLEAAGWVFGPNRDKGGFRYRFTDPTGLVDHHHTFKRAVDCAWNRWEWAIGEGRVIP
jgi:hypothetical protein